MVWRWRYGFRDRLAANFHESEPRADLVIETPIARAADGPFPLVLIQFGTARGAVLLVGFHHGNGTPRGRGSVSELRAVRVGEEGFVRFLCDLRRAGVLDTDEARGWLALHGSVLRWTESPLDDGETLNEEAFQELERVLGSA